MNVGQMVTAGLGKVVRSPVTHLVVAGAAAGAGLAALTPSLLPKEDGHWKTLAMAGAAIGGVVGLAAAGANHVLAPAAGSLVSKLSRGAVSIGPGAARAGVAGALAGAALLGAGALVARAQSNEAGWPKPSWTGRVAGAKTPPTEDEVRTFDPAWAPPGTSLVGREGLEMEGKRFLGSVTPGLAKQPLRVYAGLAHGGTVQERVRFAIDRMHELGAFDKSRILVIQPTSSGYVHDSPVAAAEVLTDGDVATVAVQYNNTAAQSIEAITTLQDGADVNEQLLVAIRDEIAKLPEGSRPEVFAYGESQGAWGSSIATTKGGGSGQFDQLGLKRAMWSGMPGFSNWRTDAPNVPARHYSDPAALQRTSVNDLGDARVIDVVNPNDPINRLDLDLIYRKPDWLGEDRPEGVPSGMTWIPGITALQVGLDGDTAIRHWRDGEFRPSGHDYRSTHAKGMQLTLGLPDLDEQQLASVNERLAALGDRSDRLYDAAQAWEQRVKRA